MTAVETEVMDKESRSTQGKPAKKPHPQYRTPRNKVRPESHPICQRVATVINQKKLTHNEIADATGSSRPHVSAVANGTKVPSLTWLLRFAAAVGVKPSELQPLLIDRLITAEDLDELID